MPSPNASDIHDVVAHQPTVGQSINALIRAFVNAASRALDNNDPAPLREMTDSMGTDPKHWSDAVLANTSLAMESAAIDHEPVRMPVGNVGGAFARPMSPEDRAAEDKRLKDAEDVRQGTAAGQLTTGHDNEQIQRNTEADRARDGESEPVPVGNAAQDAAQRQRDQAAADVRTGQAGTQLGEVNQDTAQHKAAVAAGWIDPNSPYYDPNAVKIGGGAIHF